MNDVTPPKRSMSDVRKSKQPIGPVIPHVPASLPVPVVHPHVVQMPKTPIVESHDMPVIDELRSEKPKQRSKKRVLLWVAGVILFVLIATGIALYMWYVSALKPVEVGATDKVRVQIAQGSSPSDIGQLLEEKKLIQSSVAFDIYTRVSKTQSQLQAGVYSLSASESTEQIVTHLVSGNTDQFSITFLPGATLAENRDVFVKAGYQPAEIDAAFGKAYNHPLFKDKPASADLEGYIYGETYSFSSNATVEQILTRTFDEYYKVIDDNGLIAGFQTQGLTLFEGITLASVIQREVPGAQDQKQVAQIFLKRLGIGMQLGSDVTAYYGADKIGVSRSVAVDTPYNTRIHTGLPPGPIGTPGLTALQAVAAPSRGDYIYFLSGDDEVTYFATTDAEHEANIRDHCNIKCSIP